MAKIIIKHNLIIYPITFINKNTNLKKVVKIDKEIPRMFSFKLSQEIVELQELYISNLQDIIGLVKTTNHFVECCVWNDKIIFNLIMEYEVTKKQNENFKHSKDTGLFKYNYQHNENKFKPEINKKFLLFCTYIYSLRELVDLYAIMKDSVCMRIIIKNLNPLQKLILLHLTLFPCLIPFCYRFPWSYGFLAKLTLFLR